MRLRLAVKHGRNLSDQVSAERLINMYAEPTDGKSDVVLHGSHGLDLFATCGNGPIRGMKSHNGLLYVVSGQRLYSVSSAGTTDEIGVIGGTGRVGMASNGTYLCIVTGSSGYLYGTSLAAITDSDFGGADTVESLDGYFIFGDGTGSFFINETPFNGANYDALDFASAESNPDNIVRPFVDHRELLLFGSETVEVWSNTGAEDFPFERTAGAIAEKGIASKWAIDQIDNTVFWLDQNGVVRRVAEGYATQRISTHAVEESFGTLSTATGFAFVERGHEFFALNFDNGSWLYDAATNLWHERKSWEETRWRAEFHEWAHSRNLVGDFENGNIYSLNQGTYTENGDLLVSEAVFPPINLDGTKFRLKSMQLDLEQGVSGDVRLWISNDGEVWRDAGVRSLGSTGNRNQRTIWRQLGQHRNLHIRFSISDNVKRAVFSAFAEIL